MSPLARAVRAMAARLPVWRRLKAELDQRTRQRDKLRRQLEDMRLLMQARLLSPDILRQMLPGRRAALGRVKDAAARRRDEAFSLQSPSYREAVAADAAVENGTETTVVDGMAWRAPAGSVPRAPLEELLQARELALGRAMIDIGANVGTTAIPRVLLGDFERIFAAEPDSVNYSCLVHNVIESGTRGRVLPERVAIGKCDGDTQLQQMNSTTHHLVARAPAAGRQAVTVPCLRLDTWVRRLGVDLDEVHFIKVDTQGWEPHVLMGAPETLSHKHIAWQVEFAPSMLRRAGSDTETMYTLLRSSFTHFIDMRSTAAPRSRPTSELSTALAYIERGDRSYTNLLLYNAA
jgi:FkbM family methyltransferase